MTTSKVYTSIIKLLLFPRYTNIWDLHSIFTLSFVKDPHGTSSRPHTSDKWINMLAKLSISRLKPLAKRKDNKIAIQSHDIDKWLQDTFKILDILSKHNKNEDAQILAYNFLSTYFLLVTLYVYQSSNGIKETLQFVREIKFDKNVLESLMSLPKSNEWISLFRKINFYTVFILLLSSYAFSLSKILEFIDIENKHDLSKTLSPILRMSRHYNEIIRQHISVGEENHFYSVFLSTIVMPLDAILRDYLVFNSKRGLEELMNILSFVHRIPAKTSFFRDINMESIKVSLSIVENLLKNNVEKAIEILEKFSKILFAEKMKNIGLSERINLRIAPEIFSIPPPIFPPPISISDRLSDVSLFNIVNETLEELITSSLERKNIFRIPLIINPREFQKFISRGVKDPMLSFGLSYLIGIPSAFLLETMLVILETEKTGEKDQIDLISDISSIINELLRETLSLAKNMCDSLGDHSLRKIVSFYLLRDLFFASSFLTTKLKEKLQKLEKGKSLLHTIESVSKFLEIISGQKLEKKEDISDLFA